MSGMSWMLWVLASVAPAQTIAFEDDFDCSDEASFGDPAGQFSWEAVRGGTDPFRTDGNDGVSPVTDQTNGNFGGGVDAYENALLTGSVLWDDQAIEANLINEDNEPFGLVVRYQDTGSYYKCTMARDDAGGTPSRDTDCNGNGGGSYNGVYLRRVDTSSSCNTPLGHYIVAEDTSFTYTFGQTYRMRLEAVGGNITCTVDVDGNGIGVGADLVLNYVDPAPLPPGTRRSSTKAPIRTIRTRMATASPTAKKSTPTAPIRPTRTRMETASTTTRRSTPSAPIPTTRTPTATALPMAMRSTTTAPTPPTRTPTMMGSRTATRSTSTARIRWTLTRTTVGSRTGPRSTAAPIRSILPTMFPIPPTQTVTASPTSKRTCSAPIRPTRTPTVTASMTAKR